MRRARALSVGTWVIVVFIVASCGGTEQSGRQAEKDAAESGVPAHAADSLIRPGEVHFASLEQLTNGGENAEAYWSWGGDALIMQATPRDGGCDQIYLLDLATKTQTLVSVEGGRTTCSYFVPGDEEILYSSTHLGSTDCPPVPDRSQGYVWPIYDAYDVFTRPRGGGDLIRLTDNPQYDAEATVGTDGRIVFTSLREGDLDIYVMDADGGNVQRLTDELGYDGGPFFNKDGTKIVYRADHPNTPKEKEDYLRLLDQGLIRPGALDVWVMDTDGANKTRLTTGEAAKFCPFFHPSGEKVIFSSNLNDPEGRIFQLFMVDLTGENLEQVTFEESFDGFPMFSPDGTKLVFCSNRGNERRGETNVFVAEWKD